MSNQQSAREQLSSLVEQILSSLRPQVYDRPSMMEVTLPQFKALLLLHAQGPLRMGQIAFHLGLGMPAITNLVSKLEAKGLVKREHDTEDRRVVFCSNTDRGRSEMDRFLSVRRERINALVNALNEEEVDLTIQAMGVILRAIRGQCQIDHKDQGV